MNPEMYFNPELETMSREKLEQLQLDRLRQTVGRCMNAPFYREQLDALGITPDNIQSLDDVRRLPFTTKDDLRQNYPFGLACVPLRQCTRSSSTERAFSFFAPTNQT